jgi:hypothetical protein
MQQQGGFGGADSSWFRSPRLSFRTGKSRQWEVEDIEVEDIEPTALLPRTKPGLERKLSLQAVFVIAAAGLLLPV